MSQQEPSDASRVRVRPGDASVRGEARLDAAGVDTSAIWTFSLLPLLGLVRLLLLFVLGRSPEGPDARAVADLVTSPVGVAIYVVSVKLAVRDHRNLVNAGIAKPFHWAWALLAGLVYAIGRAVVLRRNGRPSWGPMCVYIACLVVSAAATLVSIFGVGG
jgi:hypothetical protein